MSDKNFTRETLLARLKNSRDQLSWEEFCLAYERYIYLVIRAMHISHHDAEDLCQQVLTAIWQKISEYDYSPERARFRTWVSRIAHHKTVDFVRRNSAYQARLQKISDQTPLQSMSLPEIDALAEVEWKAHLSDSAWHNIKESFSPTQIECFELMNKGESVSVVAEKTGIAESSVYVYRKRIKDKLLSEIRRLEQLWG